MPLTTFDNSEHRYFIGGSPIPSVTQVLRATGILPDYRMVKREVLEQKRQLGTALHECLHFLQEGDLDESTIDEEVRPRLDAYQQFVADHDFKPLECELRMWVTLNGMRYGGCADVTGTIKEEPTLLDFKSSKGLPEPGWGCQTAAYEMGLKRPLVPPFCYRRYSLQLLENGSYKKHEWKEKSDAEVFKLALAITWWKINRGSPPWKESFAE